MKAAAVCIIEMVLFGAAMRLAIVVLQHFTYWRKVTLSEKMDLAIFEKTCNMDLHILDMPEMQTLYYEAGEANNNYRSVKILKGVFTLLSSLISIVLTAAVMVEIDPWVPLVFAVTIGVKTASVICSKRQQFKNLKLNNELQKEFNYHMNLLFDDESAQEMCMTGLADWITKKYAKIAAQAREVEMSSTNEITLNKSVDAVMSYLQTGVLYAFLAYKVIFKNMLLSVFTVFLTGMQSVSANVSSFIAAILDT